MNIIAECGVNFNSITEAMDMIHEGASIGLKYFKFQLFTKEQAPNFEHIVLTEKMAHSLIIAGLDEGVEVFFTPMYLEAVEICENIGVNFYKIRNLDRYNQELIKKIEETKKPCFISLCANDFRSLDYRKYNLDIFFPLLCVPKYPATFEDYQGIITFGYSDHTPDFQLCDFALRIPAEWFEMHVCSTHDCFEHEWSKTFEDIKKEIEINE